MMKAPLAIAVLYSMVVVYGVSTTMHEYREDPRIRNWLFMGKWGPVFYLTGAYVFMVLLGPLIMRNREAFSLKTGMKLYNLTQVILSAYMFKEFVITAYLSGYSLSCQPVEFSHKPLPMRMAAACWWFFFSKIIDVFDTIFFILRKKNSQISFLHVYHHSTMILNWWVAAKFTPGGQVFFQCMINSLVHTIMYSYYFLSVFGPAVQKYLWWKKYLTQLQLIQFTIIIIHVIGSMRTTCTFPYIFNWYVICYGLSLIALFSNFYMETYSNQKRVKANEQSVLDSIAQDKNMNYEKKRMEVITRYPLQQLVRGVL